MAGAASGAIASGKGEGDWASSADRWIFVFMAALFFVTALAGFIPDSVKKLDMVAASARPAFPMILHVHALLMGAWLSLLLVQSGLMASGNRALHMKLGIAALILAPAIVITGAILVSTIYAQYWEAASLATGAERAGFEAELVRKGNITLRNVTGAVLFPLFVVLALRARLRDSGFHKRMMFLATVVPLPAAIARLTWLPSTMPDSPLSLDLFTLVWIAPMFLWDVVRQRHIHRAYIVWFAWWLPATLLVYVLWGTDWWLTRVPTLMGVG
ncbi:MAG: hypothetical protein O9293_03275 [Porphyrobacter sp.]|nr:hypothetical protein [Porphyrobacter sp.]